MSRRFDPRGKSNSFARRNREEQQMQSSTSEYRASYSQMRRPPPGLSGKEIGLFYRDLNRERNKKKSPVFRLSPHIQQKIKFVLNNSKSFYNSIFDEKSNSEYDNKYHHIHDSQFKRKFLEILNGDMEHNLAKAMSMESKLQRNNDVDRILLNEYKDKQTQDDYLNMLKFRAKLPAYHKKSEILQLIEDNQVVVISGETGCGKTTQVAQFILDDQLEAGNGSITRIVCTQPRRISAISVAERVAAERAERLGKSVGYQIRLEKTPMREQGSILFCTTGILLQIMKTDPALKKFSHVILDEIHERTTESDFIITLLKQIIPKRTDLKVLLMSATLNSERFSRYYNECPMIHIPGFTYPVQEFYLEDILSFTEFIFPEAPAEPAGYKKHLKGYKEQQHKKEEFLDIIQPHLRQLRAEMKYAEHVINQLRNPNSENLSLDLIEKLVRYICNTKGPGAILIFLPGMMDISQLNRMMLDSTCYPSSKYIIYPLHSRMPTIDQKLIFKEPPDDIRKIIIATSIAETSITIEDVVYVIDCGKTKLGRFDVANNIQTLKPEWVSLANAKQRRGRAGRVKSGECYHLYCKAREMTFDQYPLPEMLRTRLEEVILQIKILQLGKAKEFLASVMDPPDLKAIDLSLDLLRTLNALDEEEHLTPLGYHLAHLPLDPRTGKMILWAALFSCIEPIFAIAASLTFKDAFYCPLGKEEEANKKKLELSMGEYSDHIALAEALRRFEIARRRGNAGQFCREYFLSYNTLKLLSEMKTQFAQYLCEMKFLNSDNPGDRNANRNSNNIALIKAIVCAGLYPNIAVIRSVTKNGIICWTAEDGSVRTHPSSVNFKASNFPSQYLTYFITAVHSTTATCYVADLLVSHSYTDSDSNSFINVPTIIREPAVFQSAHCFNAQFADPETMELSNNFNESATVQPDNLYCATENRIITTGNSDGCNNNERKDGAPTISVSHPWVMSSPWSLDTKLLNKDIRLREIRRLLQACGWYHESISWKQSENLLKDTSVGRWLMRDSSDSRYIFAISVQTARGPTSVRVSYFLKHFQFDAEPGLALAIPTFDCPITMLEHYVEYSKRMDRREVWVDYSGQLYSQIYLTKPLVKEVKSLSHLARLVVNRNKLPTEHLPLLIRNYLAEYPYTL